MTIGDERSGEMLEAVDRSDAAGSIGLVVVIALAMVAAVVSFLFIGRDDAEPWVIGLLALLAVMGVFALFAVAAGILQFAGRSGRFDLTKALIDGSAEGMVVVDPSGRVLYANAAYLELAGATSSDDVVPVERLYTSEPEVAEVIYRLAQAARSGRAASEEVRTVGRKGEAGRWLRLKVRPAGTQGRLAKLIAWTVADVTRERLRQEDAYVQLQQVIDYLDHGPAGFFSAEPDGTLVYINATLAEWLGYDFAEVATGGLKVSDILPGPGVALLAPQPGSAGEVKTEVIDIDLKRRSGEPLPVRLHHKVAVAPDGTAGASRTLVLDRSRGRAGADLARAAEVRFARFFNSTPMAIATVDRVGRIARVNALFARLFGGPVEVRPGGETRSVLTGLAEADRPALEAAIKAAADGKGDIAPVDASMLGGRAVRFYVVPVEEDERDQEAAIVYAIETTQQRALETQVAQSQKMTAIGQLAGGVAHDFNNVLTAIIGHADFLLESHRPTDPSFQDIMQIKHNANRAAGLVRQLLAFSRRQTLRPQVIQLGDAMSEVTMLLRRLLGETVSLDIRHGRDLWPVYIDVNQFEQVVVNLSVNARDAMPTGGKLTVRTANVPAAETKTFGDPQLPSADFVLVEVTDTGTGMPPEILDKIFDPFFTTKEVGKGTGLGLSTVYGIVKQTGGHVSCDSKVGVGTTFRIFLPRHIATEAPAVVEEPAQAKAADLTGRGTILLVEDEDSVRAFGSRALTSRGYTVLQAASGIEALDLFADHAGSIDLVVSDVVMPEMDGPTLLRELRSRRPDLKVIFVSGYAEDAFRKNLPEGEQFAFLPKPFTLKQLVEAVKETMAA